MVTACDATSDNHVMLNVDWHALAWGLDKIIRPVVVYLFLVFALRWWGKRVLAQLNPFDLVVLLTLSNTVQNAIIGDDTSLFGGLLGAVALLGINRVLVGMFYRGATWEHRLLEDKDIYLIRGHVLQEDALRQLHINVGELTARAHERGFDDLHEVHTAVLYPNGTIYMKGNPPTDSQRLEDIQQQLQALRQELAASRS
jgi:uncharacterized membrane protein YcaP (DUF421 family)